MTEHEGFLQAIAANPDDDAPRLIFSDWLEENYEAVGSQATLDLSGELDDGFKPVRGPAPGRRVKEFLAARINPESARRRA